MENLVSMKVVASRVIQEDRRPRCIILGTQKHFGEVYFHRSVFVGPPPTDPNFASQLFGQADGIVSFKTTELHVSLIIGGEPLFSRKGTQQSSGGFVNVTVPSAQNRKVPIRGWGVRARESMMWNNPCVFG